jgi:hypothetical protein
MLVEAESGFTSPSRPSAVRLVSGTLGGVVLANPLLNLFPNTHRHFSAVVSLIPN